MSQGIPDEVKRELSAALRRTSEFSRRLWALGDPEFVALGVAADPDRNRGPRAHATALHVALIVQLARYHLHADAGQRPFADVLAPFQHDADWQWLRQYRERWEHRDPPRIAEFGMQFSSQRDYRVDEGSASTLTLTAGDPPETSVDEMLRRGVSCFNLLAAQVDRYIGLLEAGSVVGAHSAPEDEPSRQ